MKITRVSPITGIVNTKELNVTNEQMYHWRNGCLIQNIMPHLTPAEREYIITGITEEDWNSFPWDEEE